MSVEVMIPQEIREELKSGRTVHRIVRLASRALEPGHIPGTEISITSMQSATVRYNVGRATKEDLLHLENFITSNNMRVVRADQYEITFESKINIETGSNCFLTGCDARTFPGFGNNGMFHCPKCDETKKTGMM